VYLNRSERGGNAVNKRELLRQIEKWMDRPGTYSFELKIQDDDSDEELEWDLQFDGEYFVAQKQEVAFPISARGKSTSVRNADDDDDHDDDQDDDDDDNDNDDDRDGKHGKKANKSNLLKLRASKSKSSKVKRTEGKETTKKKQNKK
jgi:hypothetical protein